MEADSHAAQRNDAPWAGAGQAVNLGVSRRGLSGMAFFGGFPGGGRIEAQGSLKIVGEKNTVDREILTVVSIFRCAIDCADRF
jgi:hypothetical protein